MTVDMRYSKNSARTYLTFAHSDSKGKPYPQDVITASEGILRKAAEKVVGSERMRSDNPLSFRTEYTVKIPSTAETFFQIAKYVRARFKENALTSGITHDEHYEEAREAMNKKPSPEMKSEGMQGGIRGFISSVLKAVGLG